MKFLFASDSFKGSLSSRRASQLLEAAAAEVFPEAVCTGLEMADGGEGTAAAVCAGTGGRMVSCKAADPYGRPVQASFALLDNHTAVIEMAAASGLPLLTEEERNPAETSTRGTGDLIRSALDLGCRTIAVGIGGSATSDGGMGCMAALGAVFRDRFGNELKGTGKDLIHVAEIDLEGLDPRLAETRMSVMCDVRNPLCGPQGAVRTYAAQKGADAAMCDALEEGMCHYRDVIRQYTGTDPDSLPGGGAAGGLGAALAVFLHAEMKPGAETVLDLYGFDEKIRDCSLVVTGEGCTDKQSSFGKVLQAIGERCRTAGVPCVALSASLGEGWEEILGHGVDSVITSTDRIMTLDEAMRNAEEQYRQAAERMFRLLKTGMTMADKDRK